VLNPSQIVGQQARKSAMYAANAIHGSFEILKASFVNPSLDFDMGFCFELEIPLLRVFSEIVIERAFNIHWMSIMALDEVAVVAVHRTDEVRQRFSQSFRQA
jgi:hypothetical protein